MIKMHVGYHDLVAGRVVATETLEQGDLIAVYMEPVPIVLVEEPVENGWEFFDSPEEDVFLDPMEDGWDVY